ncbi:hypothetical protein SEA_LEOPARD_20 [Mycobacterium phage Leopard]|nr:hypothetical protein SEA_LEOPARD_20 [Mycobacterium phage Leopard]
MANPENIDQLQFAVSYELTNDTDGNGYPLPDAVYETQISVTGMGQSALDLAIVNYHAINQGIASGFYPHVRRVGVLYTQPIPWSEWDVPPAPEPWAPVADANQDGVPDVEIEGQEGS